MPLDNPFRLGDVVRVTDYGPRYLRGRVGTIEEFVFDISGNRPLFARIHFLRGDAPYPVLALDSLALAEESEMPATEMPPPTLSNLTLCPCRDYLYADYHLAVTAPDSYDLAIHPSVEQELNLVAVERASVVRDCVIDGHSVPDFDPYSAEDAASDCGLTSPYGEMDDIDDDIEGYSEGDRIESPLYGRMDLIEQYGFKPPWKKYGEDVSRVLLGAEIEVESDWRRHNRLEGAAIAHEYMKHGRYGFLKEDGSIDDGFEIVTQPMAYSWAIDNFPWEMFDALGREGFSAPDNCGIHIHIDRNGFDGPQHVYRWMAFLYRNRRAVQRIARRGNVTYASWIPEFRETMALYAKGHRGGNRYGAINVQNRPTLEARFFASTLAVPELQAALGLIDASVEYTRNLPIATITREHGLSFGAFHEYCQSEGRWTPLCEEIAHRINSDISRLREDVVPRKPKRDYVRQSQRDEYGIFDDLIYPSYARRARASRFQ